MAGLSASERISTRAGEVAVRRAGAGRTIVFCHGTSCSSRAFTRQLEGELARRFRLCAIDLPGHGDSPPAARADKTYTLRGLAEHLAATAEALDVGDAVFVGWSLGGHVLLHAAAQLPRAAGFLIFGTVPFSSMSDYLSVVTDDPALAAGFKEDVTDDEAKKFVGMFVQPGAEAPGFFVDDFRRTDARSRSGVAASAGRGEFDDMLRTLAELKQPLAVFHGAHDAIVRRREWLDTLKMPTLWRGRVHDIPDAGHAPQWEQPAVFDALLDAFATDCFRGR